MTFIRRLAVHGCITVFLLAGAIESAGAHTRGPSDASAVSRLPIAVSLALPSLALSGVTTLAIVAVETSARGTVWVLERASDGARFSVTLSTQALGGLSVVAGTAVTVSAFSAGWVLSAAGQAIAYIPNEVGAALLYNEQVTR